MSFISWLLWRGEEIVADLFSRIFWPPTRVSIISVEDGKLLTLKVDSYFMLPGGFVERGERFEEAARREIKEETGLEVKNLEKLEENNGPLHGIEVVFSADVEGILEESWEGKPVWIERDKIKEKNWRFNRDVEKILSDHSL